MADSNTWCPHCGNGPVKIDKTDRETGLLVLEYPCGTQVIGRQTFRFDDCFNAQIRQLQTKVETQGKRITQLSKELRDLQGRLL